MSVLYSEPESYFDEYDTRHEAMNILWRAYSDAVGHFEERETILRAIGYVRETAMDLIPYGATVPNKDSYGRYHGKMV